MLVLEALNRQDKWVFWSGRGGGIFLFLFFREIHILCGLHGSTLIVGFCLFCSYFNPQKTKSFFFPTSSSDLSFKIKCLRIVEILKQNYIITYCRILEYSFIRWRIELQEVHSLILISHSALVFEKKWNQVHSLAKCHKDRWALMAFFLMLAGAFSSKRGKIKATIINLLPIMSFWLD